MFTLSKILIVSPILLFAVLQAEVRVRNLFVAQRPDTKLVDIYYDLINPDSSELRVNLHVKHNSTIIDLSSLSGDLGLGVTAGVGKHILWNAGNDWDGNIAALNFQVEAVESYFNDGVTTMVLIPSGSLRVESESICRLLEVEPFKMDATEITKAQWDKVYVWATTRGYRFDNVGSGKALDHPVHSINWYDAVKWCNARSEMQGLQPCYTINSQVYKTGSDSRPDFNPNANGFRLPTNEEWEYASRAGQGTWHYHWGDTISHEDANFWGDLSLGNSGSRGFHPDFEDGKFPYTSTAGSFKSNAYGLYDMNGSVWEWCWDLPQSWKNARGGSWFDTGNHARSGLEHWFPFAFETFNIGFRTVRR